MPLHTQMSANSHKTNHKTKTTAKSQGNQQHHRIYFRDRKELNKSRQQLESLHDKFHRTII